MTETNHREIIYVLLIVVFFFALLLPAFLYTAHQDLVSEQQRAVPAPGLTMSGLKDGMFVEVKIGSAVVRSEVAQSDAKKKQGLSGRDSLADNAGMLFVFNKEGTYPFWNKDMRFPLDMIWINGTTVVDSYEGLPPFSGVPVTLTPKASADLVLEVNASFIKKYQIKAGDRVSL